MAQTVPSGQTPPEVVLSYDPVSQTWGQGTIRTRVAPATSPDQPVAADISFKVKPDILVLEPKREGLVVHTKVRLGEGALIPRDRTVEVTITAKQSASEYDVMGQVVGAAGGFGPVSGMMPAGGSQRIDFELTSVVHVVLVPFAIHVTANDPRTGQKTIFEPEDRETIISIWGNEKEQVTLAAEVVYCKDLVSSAGPPPRVDRWTVRTTPPGRSAFTVTSIPSTNPSQHSVHVQSVEALPMGLDDDPEFDITFKAIVAGKHALVRSIHVLPELLTTSDYGIPRKLVVGRESSVQEVESPVHGGPVPNSSLDISWDMTPELVDWLPANTTTDGSGTGRTTWRTISDADARISGKEPPSEADLYVYLGSKRRLLQHYRIPVEIKDPSLWLVSFGKAGFAKQLALKITDLGPSVDELEPLTTNGGDLTFSLLPRADGLKLQYEFEPVAYAVAKLVVGKNQRLRVTPSQSDVVTFHFEKTDPGSADVHVGPVSVPMPINDRLLAFLVKIETDALTIDPRLADPVRIFITKCVNHLGKTSSDELLKDNSFENTIRTMAWYLDANVRFSRALTETIEARIQILEQLTQSTANFFVDLALIASFWGAGKVISKMGRETAEQAAKKAAHETLSELVETATKDGVVKAEIKALAREADEAAKEITRLTSEAASTRKTVREWLEELKSSKTPDWFGRTGRGIDEDLTETLRGISKNLKEATGYKRLAEESLEILKHHDELLTQLGKAAKSGDDQLIRQTIDSIKKQATELTGKEAEHLAAVRTQITKMYDEALGLKDLDVLSKQLITWSQTVPEASRRNLAETISRIDTLRVTVEADIAAAAKKATRNAVGLKVGAKLALEPYLQGHFNSCAVLYSAQRESYLQKSSSKPSPLPQAFSTEKVTKIAALAADAQDLSNVMWAPETGLASDTKQLDYSLEAIAREEAQGFVSWLLGSANTYVVQFLQDAGNFMSEAGFVSSVIPASMRELGAGELRQIGLLSTVEGFASSSASRVQNTFREGEKPEYAQPGARERLLQSELAWVAAQGRDQLAAAKDVAFRLCLEALERTDPATSDLLRVNLKDVQVLIDQITADVREYKSAISATRKPIWSNAFETTAGFFKGNTSWAQIQNYVDWIGWTLGWVFRVLPLFFTPAIGPAGLALYYVADDIADVGTSLLKMLVGSTGSLRDMNGMVLDLMLLDAFLSFTLKAAEFEQEEFNLLTSPVKTG